MQKELSKQEVIETLSGFLNKPYADPIKTLIAYLTEEKSPEQIINFWHSQKSVVKGNVWKDINKMLISYFEIKLHKPKEKSPRDYLEGCLKTGKDLSIKELKNLAFKMGYVEIRETKEGTLFGTETGQPVTIIPNHEVSKKTKIKIMKELLMGKLLRSFPKE